MGYEISLINTSDRFTFEVPNFCSLCEVPAPARRVAVRGLCELSMFDKWLPFFFGLVLTITMNRCCHLSMFVSSSSCSFCFLSLITLITLATRVYNYIINEEGQPMYLGHRTSVLYYNKSIPSWVWYDRKDPSSVAISISPEASLLLGELLISCQSKVTL